MKYINCALRNTKHIREQTSESRLGFFETLIRGRCVGEGGGAGRGGAGGGGAGLAQTTWSSSNIGAKTKFRL